MKITKSLSMRVALEKTKLTVDGSLPITIHLTVSGKRTVFYLGIKIRAEHFNQDTGTAIGDSPEAKAINNLIAESQKPFKKQVKRIAKQVGRIGDETIAGYLDGLTLKAGSHEGK